MVPQENATAKADTTFLKRYSSKYPKAVKYILENGFTLEEALNAIEKRIQQLEGESV